MPRKFNGRKRRDFTEFKNSAVLNASTYRLWLDRLTDLAISRFKWENLPDSVDERFLELTLFSMGYAVWMRDPVLGVDLALTASLEGEFDVYNNPIYRRVYAANGITSHVIIWIQLSFIIIISIRGLKTRPSYTLCGYLKSTGLLT